MCTQSNDQGRAFEYITLLTLGKEISRVRQVAIEKNSSYYAAERAWNSIDTSLQNTLSQGAFAAVDTIFDLEPLILEE